MELKSRVNPSFFTQTLKRSFVGESSSNKPLQFFTAGDDNTTTLCFTPGLTLSLSK